MCKRDRFGKGRCREAALSETPVWQSAAASRVCAHSSESGGGCRPTSSGACRSSSRSVGCMQGTACGGRGAACCSPVGGNPLLFPQGGRSHGPPKLLCQAAFIPRVFRVRIWGGLMVVLGESGDKSPCHSGSLHFIGIRHVNRSMK